MLDGLKSSLEINPDLEIFPPAPARVQLLDSNECRDTCCCTKLIKQSEIVAPILAKLQMESHIMEE
jgi:hypothetical protein